MRSKLVALVAGALSLGFVQVASAADMPVKARAPMPAPVYNWTGVYLGAQGGYGWGSADWSNMIGYVDTTADVNPRGALGGGHLGYNWQTGMWVLGIEGSWSWADLKETANNPGGTASRSSKIKDIALVTGKAGVAFDRTMVYFRGGYANANARIDSLVFATGVTSTGSERRSGYVLGLGADYALAPNWIVGVEYNYIGLENKFLGTTFSNGPCAGCGANVDPKLSTITGRVSYKFGS